MSLIYGPEEDSYLMQEVLEKELLSKNTNILEIGCGSGILLNTLLNLKVNSRNIIAIDINPSVINHINNNFPDIRIIKSNFFQILKENIILLFLIPHTYQKIRII